MVCFCVLVKVVYLPNVSDQIIVYRFVCVILCDDDMYVYMLKTGSQCKLVYINNLCNPVQINEIIITIIIIHKHQQSVCIHLHKSRVSDP
jgi:hypothetical protein